MTDAYPLRWPAGWPRARWRQAGRFARSLDADRTIDELMAELGRLKATDIVISTNLKPRNVSMTNGADPRIDPGVAIYFRLSGRQMSMAQDGFDSVAKNARSLTLAIDAMRAIERHGGGHMMQRSFDGFAALPPPAGGASARLRPWREVLGMEGVDTSLIPEFQRAIVEDRYKKLAKERHPDGGGTAEAFAELNAAVTQAREELR